MSYRTPLFIKGHFVHSLPLREEVGGKVGGRGESTSKRKGGRIHSGREIKYDRMKTANYKPNLLNDRTIPPHQPDHSPLQTETRKSSLGEVRQGVSDRCNNIFFVHSHGMRFSSPIWMIKENFRWQHISKEKEWRWFQIALWAAAL